YQVKALDLTARHGMRAKALDFLVCAGRHSDHDNGCRRDRSRCLPDERLLLRPVAALRGQPEVIEGAGQRCWKGCLESTQKHAADRSCRHGCDLPVDPRQGALRRITVRSSCWWAYPQTPSPIGPGQTAARPESDTPTRQ